MAAAPKTRPTEADVDEFLAAVPDQRRRAEGIAMRDLMASATGATPVMWGPSIVGFGSMAYTNTTGTYDWPIVGFSPRKASLTLYGVHDGYAEADPRLEQLGEHTVSKGCLYIKHLDRVDHDVLRDLIRSAWARYA